MKIVALLLVFLLIGDVVLHHGIAIAAVGHAGHYFAHGVARTVNDSLFAV